MENKIKETLKTENEEVEIFDLDTIEEGSDLKHEAAVLAVGTAVGVVCTLVFPKIVKGAKWCGLKVKTGFNKIFKKEEIIDVETEEVVEGN